MMDETDTPKRAGTDTRKRAHELLRSSRRRFVLGYLLGEDQPLSVEELVEAVTDWEFGEDATERNREDVAISLHHAHLPRMADLGVVEYDRETGTVEERDDPLLEAEWLDPTEAEGLAYGESD